MNKKELKDFLDEKVLQYNTLDFIDSDPVQIPHRFSVKVWLLQLRGVIVK